MKVLNKNEKISVYGNLRIKSISKKQEKNIGISIKNKEVSKIGDYLYDFLEKQYKQFNYNWDDISKKIKTNKIIIDNKVIKPIFSINIYGYVEDRCGIPSENGKRYNFSITEIAMEDFFERLEKLYDNYIYEFDTVKNGLKFVIEKIEIK
ncbi:MAG: hypothetical protein HFJ51_04695 [Clostridia bacterium]|nr:hypothetical protein [Clostridia bacterium]